MRRQVNSALPGWILPSTFLARPAVANTARILGGGVGPALGTIPRRFIPPIGIVGNGFAPTFQNRFIPRQPIIGGGLAALGLFNPAFRGLNNGFGPINSVVPFDGINPLASNVQYDAAFLHALRNTPVAPIGPIFTGSINHLLSHSLASNHMGLYQINDIFRLLRQSRNKGRKIIKKVIKKKIIKKFFVKKPKAAIVKKPKSIVFKKSKSKVPKRKKLSRRKKNNQRKKQQQRKKQKKQNGRKHKVH